MSDFTQCNGYQSLFKAVERDQNSYPDFHRYLDKFEWIINQVNHYAEKTGLAATDILDAWEAKRSYWYMNYYQEANQPTIKGDMVRVFETTEDFAENVGNKGFRCPACGGVSKRSSHCTTRLKIGKKVCDWKSYGLLGCLGKGVYVFIKKDMLIAEIFMPVAWEPEPPVSAPLLTKAKKTKTKGTV